MTTESRKPDWPKWRQRPRWGLYEAVALSLDIEPDKVKLNKLAWMGADHPFAESTAFSDRLETLRRNAYGPDGLNAKHAGQWYQATVNAREFAAWAKQSKWDVPPELKKIARGPSEAVISKLEPKRGKDEPAPDKRQGWRRREILATIRKLGETPNNLPPRPPDAKGWKDWVKSKVWKELNWPKNDRGAFDNLWQAMRSAGEIAERDSTDPPS